MYRAVSGAVLHMLGKAATSGTTNSSSFGLGIVFIANSSFHHNNVFLDADASSFQSFSTTYDTLQGAGAYKLFGHFPLFS